MEVVRLRILSRRWKNVCKLRGELRLNCLDMFRVNQSHDKCSRQDQFRFLKAVDNCLQLCSCQTITCLEISCCFLKRFTSDFIRWMQSIATLDIQELHLRFLCSSSPLCEHVKSSTIDLFPISFQLLSKAATLKHLHLCACVLQPRFTSQFNSLKSLYLDLVPMSNGELPRILSSCVNLQTLRVAYCKLSPKLCISGQCLQLKCLYVHSCPGLQEIVICAKNLNTFSCFAEGTMKFSLDVPNLEDARVHVRGPNAMPYMFGEVFKDCTKLKFLLFQIRTNEIRYVPTKMDMFSNLRTLSFVPIIETLADELEIAPILVACPLLEKLRLQFLCEGINQKRGRNWPTEPLACLKEVDLDGFKASLNEIDFACYLARNAPVLERLTTRPTCRIYVEDFAVTTAPSGAYLRSLVTYLHGLVMLHAISNKLEVNVLGLP
nr:uncharacterized protein LOC113690728 isoform X2 [Coffea arabica]